MASACAAALPVARAGAFFRQAKLNVAGRSSGSELRCALLSAQAVLRSLLRPYVMRLGDVARQKTTMADSASVLYAS